MCGRLFRVCLYWINREASVRGANGLYRTNRASWKCRRRVQYSSRRERGVPSYIGEKSFGSPQAQARNYLYRQGPREIAPTQECASWREECFRGKYSEYIFQPVFNHANRKSPQQATKPVKGKAQENKTTRMPQNELLDLVYQCFREYKYWPFKTLKARLRQPEAYLKQTLEMVAHLVKSGDFAMTWELKPEAKESNYANAFYGDAKEELAPGTGLNLDDVSEEDPTASGMDEDMQFESVV